MGLVALVSKRVRFAASYLILGSTLGLVGAVALSTLALLAITKIAEAGYLGSGSLALVLVLFGNLAGILVGGLLGTVGGGLAAFWLNRWLGVGRSN